MPLKQTAVTGIPFPDKVPDVQRTSFSLDVMGRFICNSYDEAIANPDFDVVVIGSGMYGAYAAAKLYRDSRSKAAQDARSKPLRILVLEAGPFLVHEHSQNIPDLNLSNPFKGEPPDDPKYLVWGKGWRSGNTYFPGTAYCVGGKSLYWGGWCPRLRDADLAQWPEEVRDYLLNPPKYPSNFPNRLSSPGNNSVYEEVEFEMGVKPPDDFVFDPVNGKDEPDNITGLNRAFGDRIRSALGDLRANGGTPLQDPEPPPIAVQTQSFVSGVFSPDKFSSLTLLISALRSTKNDNDDKKSGIFLVPHAHVSKLVVPQIRKDGADTEGYRVTSIQLTADGAPKTLTIGPSCTVILALGCIESTRLALESFPTAPHRGGDELMGRNLMAHLRFDFGFNIDRNDFRDWFNQNNNNKVLSDNLQTAAFHVQANTNEGRFHLQVYATGTEFGGDGEGLFYKMIPDAELAQQLADDQTENTIKVIFRACGEMRGDRTAKVYDPGTNWIDLAKSPADQDTQFGHGRAFVHYEDQSNAPIWKLMRDACEGLAGSIGANAFPPEDKHGVGTTWHDSGTLFMGNDPAESVTDENGHFHHIANAMCVDQALFPTVGSANPVLTGLCLSRKATESLLERFTSEPEPGAADIAREKADGFEFLLEGANSAKWKVNNPLLVDGQPLLIENGTVLEVQDANISRTGLGVAYYDDPSLFGDFELRLQWKAFFDDGTGGDITANSGIFLRCPLPPGQLTDANFYDKAVEIQIDDTGYDAEKRRFRSPLHRTGAIYKVAPARVRIQKIPATKNTPGFWNTYHIVARGTRIRVELNGSLVSEGDVSAALSAPGHIAFQFHTGKVQFRSVRVKRL